MNKQREEIYRQRNAALMSQDISERVLDDIRDAVGDEFIIGLATSVDATTPVAMQVDQLCEIVAWHDERQLMDYVTCGTGSYFNFGEIMPIRPSRRSDHVRRSPALTVTT